MKELKPKQHQALEQLAMEHKGQHTVVGRGKQFLESKYGSLDDNVRKSVTRTVAGVGVAAVAAMIPLWFINDLIMFGGLGYAVYHGRGAYHYVKNKITGDYKR